MPSRGIYRVVCIL